MDGYLFWKNVDRILGQQKLIDAAEKAGINYRTIKNQRSDSRLPRLEDAFKIARSLGTTVEYLMTGEMEEEGYPIRIERIIDRCLIASDDDLALVERVLRIEPDCGEKSSASGALA